MVTFEKGQTVWGARLMGSGFYVGSAVVKSCGVAQVRLVSGNEPAFGYRVSVPLAEVFNSEIEALQALTGDAERAAVVAEAKAKHAREILGEVRAAIVALVSK